MVMRGAVEEGPCVCDGRGGGGWRHLEVEDFPEGRGLEPSGEG